jgi:hypothetical protein
VLTILSALMFIIRGAMLLGWDLEDENGWGLIIRSLIATGLMMWMIVSVKTLGERIEKGEISAQDPKGLLPPRGQAMQVQGGVQLAPVAVVVIPEKTV